MTKNRQGLRRDVFEECDVSSARHQFVAGRSAGDRSTAYVRSVPGISRFLVALAWHYARSRQVKGTEAAACLRHCDDERVRGVAPATAVSKTVVLCRSFGLEGAQASRPDLRSSARRPANCRFVSRRCGPDARSGAEAQLSRLGCGILFAFIE